MVLDLSVNSGGAWVARRGIQEHRLESGPCIVAQVVLFISLARKVPHAEGPAQPKARQAHNQQQTL